MTNPWIIGLNRRRNEKLHYTATKTLHISSVLARRGSTLVTLDSSEYSGWIVGSVFKQLDTGQILTYYESKKYGRQRHFISSVLEEMLPDTGEPIYIL